VRILARDLAVGVGIGAFSGLLGVGGGILLVPFLVLALHWNQKNAQATSLVMITLASVSGALTYAFGDSVDWLAAGFIIIGGLAGSWIGSHVVQRTADHRLQILFGALLVIVSIRLILSTGDAVTTARMDFTPWQIVGLIISGLAMGVLSALFGIGGGILLIPILVTVFDFSQQLAAGTSLAVMAPIALLGAIRLTKPGLTNWPIGVRFGIGAIAGAVIGSIAALSMPAETVRIIFAAVQVFVAVRMIQTGLRGRRAIS
jgi:uncharacterized membrane protein YfcA